MKNIDASVIFFETANRLTDTLKTLNQIFKERKIAIDREITKIYEEVKTGTPEELFNHFSQNGVKGEIVGIISPCKKKESFDSDKIQKTLLELLEYMPLKSASEFVAKIFDISKKEVYNLGIKLKNK